jgi:hypothetical protein
MAARTRDRNTFRGYILAATALSRITGFFIAASTGRAIPRHRNPY